jgi:hypothetical protein
MTDILLDDAALDSLAALIRGGAQPTPACLLSLIAELRRLRTDNFYLDLGQEKLADEVRRLRAEVEALRGYIPLLEERLNQGEEPTCNCDTWDDNLPGGAQGANPSPCPVHEREEK